LIEAFRIEIKQTSISSVKFSIIFLSNSYACIRFIAQPATALDLVELSFGIKPMNKQVLILIDGEIDVIAGLIAFSGVSAGVIDHNSY